MARFRRKWRSCSHVKPDAAVELEAVAGEEALALAGGRLGHGGRDGPAIVVLGDRERGEVARGTWLAPRRGSSRPAGASRPGRSRSACRTAPGPWRTAASARRSPDRWPPSTAPAPWWPPRAPARSPDRRPGPPARRALARRGPRRRTASWWRSAGSGRSPRIGAAAADEPGTTNTPSPDSPRATTATSEAVAPSSTCDFTPSSVQPPADGRAVVPTVAGRHTPSSATASVPVHVPAATASSRNADPASRRTGASCVAVARKGDGATARPSSSTTMPTSRYPRPRPPCSSGTRGPASRAPPASTTARRRRPCPRSTARTSDGGQADAQHRPGVLPQRELVVGELEVHRPVTQPGRGSPGGSW